MAPATAMFMAVSTVIVLPSMAVTPATSTPTSDSNYMVLQGEWSYLASRGVSHGDLAGHVQLVRSALTATSTFSFTVQFADPGTAPASGTTLTAVIGRHICSVVDSAGAATPYQDPYSCPGYSSATDTNACDSSAVALDPNVEATLSCTVTDVGAARVCTGSLAWPVYIPEFFEEQNLEDLSFVLSSSSGEFACANLDQNRDLTAADSTDLPNAGSLTSGNLEKDELGYTHMQLSVSGLTPSTAYTAYVSSSPCDTSGATFAGPSAVAGLTAGFTTDGSGDASSIAAFITSIASAATMSIIIDESGSPVACYDLELPSFPGGRTGSIGVADNDADVDACEVWAPFYSSDEADAFGMGKKKKKKKGKGSDSPAFSNFASTSIASEARCCLTSSYDIDRLASKGRKSKASSLVMGMTSKEIASRSGVYAGVAGACVLAVAAAMHIRRTRTKSIIAPATDDNSALLMAPSETTPLTKN